MFDRLSQSAAALLQCIREDEVKHPQDVLQTTAAGGKESSVSSGRLSGALQCKSLTPLPDRFKELLGGAEIACLLGVAPQVRRAWLTVDNRLFLWDFGALDQTFEACVQEVHIEASSEFIVGVSIVTPKGGIFVDDVNHLAAVATTAEVILLALSYDCDSNALGVTSTPYAVDTEGVMMLSVAGACDGRIFMGGSDGNLYELYYDDEFVSPRSTAAAWAGAVSSFFADASSEPRAKCRKVKHLVWRWRVIHLLLPPFIARTLGGDDSSVSLQYLCLDPSRDLLHACTKSSNLSTFTVAAGAPVTPVARDYNISDRAAAFVRSSGGASATRMGALMGLHVGAAGAASSGASLVAVFDSGARVSLALLTTGFQVLDVRSTAIHSGSLAFSFYEEGVTIACGARGGQDAVSAVTLVGAATGWHEEASTLTLPRQQGCDTLSCAGTVDIKSRDIAGGNGLLALLAANSKSPAASTTAASLSPYTPVSQSADFASLRALLASTPSCAAPLTRHALQTFGCSREYLLLSPAGLATLSQSWPVDSLARLLRTSSAPAKSEEVAAVFAASGHAQACAMCLLIAVDNSSSPADTALQHKATRLAVHMGGDASCTIGAGGVPVVRMSAMHDGVYMLASRLLRPLWFRPVLASGGLIGAVFTLGAASSSSSGLGSAVECVLRPLQVLCDDIIAREFASAFRARLTGGPAARPPSAGMTEKQMASCARAAEDASIFALRSLLQRFFQALALISVLRSGGDLLCGGGAWAGLDGVSLQEWVCCRQTAGALRSALVVSLATCPCASDEVEQMMRRLHQECGCYFGTGGYIVCLAMRNLHCCANGQAQCSVADVLYALLRCCVYWTGEGDVTGEQSALPRCVSMLMRMDNSTDAAHAAVMLCLATANTFGGCATLGAAFLEARTALTIRIDSIERTAGGRDVGGYGAGAGSPSSELDEAQRTSLRSAVYAYLCSFMLQQGEPLMAELVWCCLESGGTDDPLLAEELCRRLHAEHPDVMLAIQAQVFEDYLELSDPLALHRYFSLHGRLREAAVFMDNLASEEGDCPLESRIQRFQLALSSALAYLRSLRECEAGGQQGEGEGDTAEDIEAYVEQLRSRLVTARYQLRLLRALGSEGSGVLRREEEEALSLRRAEETHLFREVGLKYGQFDVCLLLLCAAPYLSDDPELTERLARSLVHRLLPSRVGCGGPAEAVWRDFLRQRADAALPGEPAATAGSSLCDAGWAQRIQASMADLGAEMFGSADMAGGSAEQNVPLHVIVGELVDVSLALRRTHAAAAQQQQQLFLPSEGFAGSLLRSMGVSPSLVAEGFLRCLSSSRGSSLERQSLLARLCVLELQKWVSDVSVEADARASLVEYIGSGRMEAACGAARSAISSLLSSRRIPVECAGPLRDADDELSSVLARVDALVTTHR